MKYVELIPGTKARKEKDKYFEDIDLLNDAGILLDKDVLFVDFDDLEENKKREERIIKAIKNNYPSSLTIKTDKGLHLYYKSDEDFKQATKIMLVGGFQADFRPKGYGVLKRNGKVREYEGELSFENLTNLPEVLLPLYYCKESKNLCGLKEGERNDSLFKHLCLIRRNYDNLDLLSIANFINKYVFDEPLPETEVESIVESALSYDIELIVTEEKEGKNLIDISKIIVDKYDVYVVNNQIFFKYDDIYINDDYLLMKLISKDYELRQNGYKEVFFQLLINGKTPENDESVILLKNGALKNNTFIEDFDGFSTYYLDIVYNPDAYDEKVDEFLQFISNNENSKEKNSIRLVIEEMIGHCLMTKNFPHKIFFLLGIGANGKSTFLNMLRSMFDYLQVSIPIKKLELDNYLARITNKLVNISDDDDYNYINSTQIIKTLASGDYVTARDLFEKSYTFKNMATMIFSMNELVTFNDKSYGMERRLCIIPFNNKVKEANPKLIESLTTDSAKSYLLKLGIEGMNRIINNGYQLSDCTEIDKEINEYLIETNSIYGFLQAEKRFNPDDGTPFSVFYEYYIKYCEDNGFKNPFSKNRFSRNIKTYGYCTKVVNKSGNSIRMVYLND